MFLKIKVSTDSKSEKIIKKLDDVFQIHVKEKAERGQANKRVIELLRKAFKEYNKIKIIKGHHSSSKIISLEK